MKNVNNLGAYLQLFYSATETSKHIEIFQGEKVLIVHAYSKTCKMSTKID